MAESATRSDDGKPAWWHMLDRAYKMMEMAGYRVAEHNPDHNNPIVAWMADARVMLHYSRHDDVDKMADGLRVLADLPCPPDERELLLCSADALTARFTYSAKEVFLGIADAIEAGAMSMDGAAKAIRDAACTPRENTKGRRSAEEGAQATACRRRAPQGEHANLLQVANPAAAHQSVVSESVAELQRAFREERVKQTSYLSYSSANAGEAPIRVWDITFTDATVKKLSGERNLP